MNNFQYRADYDYFLNALANGDVNLFENKFSKLFDFRDPKIKRAEFNKQRNDIFKKFVKVHGKTCQLSLCSDCCNIKKYHIDHYIPLSTNELNKKLRGMKPVNGKKVPSQSFGSNDMDNLRIACERCNSHKKHRIII